jgi:PAS domain S-box-containing protein
MHLGLRSKGIAVLALPMLALVLAPAAFLYADRADQDAQAAVTRTLAIEADLRRVLGLVVDSETAARGYLITRQLAFLEPYNAAKENLPKELDRLQSTIRDPNQHRRLQVLRPLIDRRQEISQEMILFPPDTPRPEVVATLQDGKTTTDRIRGTIAAMEEGQARLLTHHRAKAERAHGAALATALAGSVIGLFGGGASMVVFTWGVARRVGSLEQVAVRMEHGLPVEAPPDGDEVSRVGKCLAKASALLRQREATLQAVFDASPDIIAISAPDRRFRSINAAFQWILGHPPADWLGRDFLELIHPEDRSAVADDFQRVFAREQPLLHFRCRGQHAAGHWVVLEAQGSLLAETGGDGDGLVAVTRDVTERNRLEQVEQEARRAAEEANRAKSEFLSRMSHELRTPLNAVLGFGQLLELDPLTPEQTDAVEHILKGGRHLLSLIDEVLDIARIEMGKMTLSLESVHITELVHDALDLIRPMASQRSIHLLTHGMDRCEVYVLADRQRLSQILLNLLSNAVKFNRISGGVTVSCKVLDNCVRINVADTGPGIRPEHLPLLFTPFERLGAERDGTEGTGIGLALSRRLAEAMGGTLDVDTVYGQGSTFYVTLPLVEGPVERYDRLNGATPEDMPITGGDHRTVLYVEDDLSNVKLIERVFAQRSNIELIVAMQGRLGLDLAQEHLPDLVLLDLHLPDLTGDQVLQRLRDDPATASIPVVILSADATPGQIRRLLAAGATAYLTKPLNVRELLKLLDQTLADEPSRGNEPT